MAAILDSEKRNHISEKCLYKSYSYWPQELKSSVSCSASKNVYEHTERVQDWFLSLIYFARLFSRSVAIVLLLFIISFLLDLPAYRSNHCPISREQIWRF